MDRRTVLGGMVGAAAMPAVAIQGAPRRPYKVIACEEAFSTPEIVAASRRLFGQPSMRSGPIAGPFMPNLLDLGEGRIAGMDAAGIDIQVLAVTSPGVQNFEPAEALSLARAANDRLADAARRFPGRYVGLATLAPQAAAESAKELERCVRTLGFKGGLINSHTNNLYLDDPKFWPILEAAQALDVPLYLHPREPAQPREQKVVIPGFNVGWGYGVETGTHVLHLIAAGVFDRFPRLRMAVGHLGETLPFILDRLDNRFQWEGRLFPVKTLEQLPSAYIRRNLVVTTSGMNYKVPMQAAIAALGIDKVLFAADHPMEDEAEAVQLAEAVPMSAADRAKLFEGNARRFFGITA